MDSDIRHAVHRAATATDLVAKGYPVYRVGTHSIRASGATTLAILGYSLALIKKLGRWTSDTYLVYIQSQIAELTHGVSTLMSKTLAFHQVGAIRASTLAFPPASPTSVVAAG
jgi:hypothetical protein